MVNLPNTPQSNSRIFNRFIFFMAFRYLRKRFTSYIAITGVALGVMVLIIVLSVMGGFQKAFWERLRSSSGDIAVESKKFFGIFDYKHLARELEKVEGVKGAAPFIESLILVESTMIDFGILRGIDPQAEAKIGNFSKYIHSPRETYEFVWGKEDNPETKLPAELEAYLKRLPDKVDMKNLFKTKSGKPGIILGVEMFRQYHREGLELGHIITLTAPAGKDLENFSSKREDGEKEVPEGTPKEKKKLKTKEMDFEVVGTFKVGIFKQDRRIVYTSIPNAQNFIDVPGRVSGLNVRCEDYRDSEEIKQTFRNLLPTIIYNQLNSKRPFNIPNVKTWKEKNIGLWKAVQMEKFLLSFLLFFIVMVAGFMILAILFMLVAEKTKDIGILKSLGSTNGGVLSIFLYQGTVIGLIGIALGLCLGLAFTYNINAVADFIHSMTGYHPFPPNIYYLDRIPARVDWQEVTIIAVLTQICCMLFALFPAYRASRKSPIQSMRYQ